jgi:hypothetical protein
VLDSGHQSSVTESRPELRVRGKWRVLGPSNIKQLHPSQLGKNIVQQMGGRGRVELSSIQIGSVSCSIKGGNVFGQWRLIRRVAQREGAILRGDGFMPPFLKTNARSDFRGRLRIVVFLLPHLSEYDRPRAVVRVRAGSGMLLSRIPSGLGQSS